MLKERKMEEKLNSSLLEETLLEYTKTSFLKLKSIKEIYTIIKSPDAFQDLCNSIKTIIDQDPEYRYVRNANVKKLVRLVQELELQLLRDLEIFTDNINNQQSKNA